jgi:pyruvate formate lyase activating enzyme
MLLKIGGFQKTTLIDYPGKVSCIIFLSGCNFHCPYCHNPALVSSAASDIDPDEIFRFLRRRQGLLDGVVISGGEPTLQARLPSFCRRVKELGFLVKLDTNGSRPEVLSHLLEEGLVDYVAMDLKTAPERYAPIICDTPASFGVRESVQTILDSRIPHEFRTTCIQPLVDPDAVEQMAPLVAGAREMVLQKAHVNNGRVLDPSFFQNRCWQIDDAALEGFRRRFLDFVKSCRIR